MKSPTYNEVEETQEQTETRLLNEAANIVAAMRQRWDNARDWNVVTDDNVQILDAQDNVIATITTKQLDAYYDQNESNL